jgi:formylglycine-generating enzyme required for sulfatase activity
MIHATSKGTRTFSACLAMLVPVATACGESRGSGWTSPGAYAGTDASDSAASIAYGGADGDADGGDAGPGDAAPEAAPATDADVGDVLPEGGPVLPEGGGVAESSTPDGGAFAPSCQGEGPGLSGCGADAESCCTSLEVPGGTFFQNYPNAAAGTAGFGLPATVSGFRLDKYLVTVGRFRQFVAALKGGWLPAAGSGKHTHLNAGRGLIDGAAPSDAGTVYETGWLASDDGNIAPTDANLNCDAVGVYPTWTSTVGAQEDLPITCVNWYEAYAFCIWDGGFLPSSPEWEYVAAGGIDQREYPWGSTAPGTSNQYAIYGCYYPGESGACSGVANIAPVGTANLGAGKWGQLDLAGETWEWVIDRNFVSCTDCAGLTPFSATIGWQSRGGTFDSPASYITPLASAGGGTGSLSVRVGGIRCARGP